MKLSHTVGYALQALVLLARQEGGRGLTSTVILQTRGLTGKLPRLVTAGVLVSAKGPRGGYRLARSAQDINLLEVIEAVDGPIEHGTLSLNAPAGVRLDARLRAICARAAEVVRGQLRAVTLADLAGRRESAGARGHDAGGVG